MWEHRGCQNNHSPPATRIFSAVQKVETSTLTFSWGIFFPAYRIIEFSRKSENMQIELRFIYLFHGLCVFVTRGSFLHCYLTDETYSWSSKGYCSPFTTLSHPCQADSQTIHIIKLFVELLQTIVNRLPNFKPICWSIDQKVPLNGETITVRTNTKFHFEHANHFNIWLADCSVTLYDLVQFEAC